MATKIRASKVNAGYRLPEDLVARIRVKAATENLRPCEVAERWLRAGAQQEPGNPGLSSESAPSR